MFERVVWDSRSVEGEEKRTAFLGAGWDSVWEDWAWAKSAAREGSLGWVSVEAVAVEAWPWNCEERSACCLCRDSRVSPRLEALLREC